MGSKGREPTLWSEDPSGGPAGAADLLRGVPRPRPASERELARLGVAVDLLADTPPRTQSLSGWWRLLWARPVAVGAAFLITIFMLGTAVALWRTDDQEVRRSPEVVPLPLRAKRAVRLPPPAPVESNEPDIKAPAPPERRATPKRARHPAPSATATAPVVGESLLREAALVDRARAALASDPAQALTLLEQHRHDAPEGQLAPEREFLSVAALCRLGKIEEASRRAAALDRRKPASAYAARARRLVEAARDANGTAGNKHEH